MAGMEDFEDPTATHGLADRTFKDTLTLFSGDEAIDFYYFGPAHTDGDAFIVFRALRVMHAGDVFQGPRLPSVDPRNGGSIEAYPQTLAKAATGIKGVDVVIPGHGAITTWQTFASYGEIVRRR